jgi:hypothetical protein
VTILSTFPTNHLLVWVIVSRRFHSLILRILHFRLLLAAALPDCKLILEAYHPSRTSAGNAYLYCTYLGTDGLSSKHEGEGSLYADCAGEEGRFAKLGALYSRFRPERPTVTASMPLRRIAGIAPAQSLAGETSQPIYADSGDGGSTKVAHVLNLDADELFGQFCAYPQLVRFGPRRGVFLSSSHIVQHGQGVMRVWKHWLQDRALELWHQQQQQQQEQEQEQQEHGQDPLLQAHLSRSATLSCPTIGADKNILWTDYKKNVGLRVAVRERDGRLYGKTPDEYNDSPMSFLIEIQGRHALSLASYRRHTFSPLSRVSIKRT